MSEKPNFKDILKMFSKKDHDKLLKVWEFSDIHLSSIIRRSGETYSLHGLEIACTLLESTKDISQILVALLHDLPLHPDGEYLLSKIPLEEKEKNAIRSMNRLRRLHIDESTEDLDYFIGAISEEENLLPIRMAHRLNDVRHLDRFTKELQKKIAYESLHMYAPIAGRLGLHNWRYEMEDICFRKLQASTVKKLQEKYDEYASLDSICLHQTFSFLQEKFRGAKIPVRLEARIKTLYSTYRKMMKKNRRFEELTDRLAIRIITNSLEDCYRCLGIVHTHMNPIAGKLKDYIGAPKENGYQSIHTVVYPLPGVTEQPIEIQIRTEDMDILCQFGSSAHGEYKIQNYALKTGRSRTDLIKNFQILRVKGRSPVQFEEALRTYFSEHQMSIFDAQNNLYHIKRPATVLDFLCIVFPSKVSCLKYIRLNGRSVPVDANLHDGDVVEATFNRHRSVSPDWTKACKQKESIQKIREILGAKM